MLDFKTILEAFKEAGYEPYSYSGRGMYGARCLAVDFDSGSAVDVVLSVLQNCFEEDLNSMIESLRGAKQDSMGRGAVVYWPRIAWDKKVEQLSEGCEECGADPGEGCDPSCPMSKDSFGDE